jgi:hypothetical protein
MQGCQMVCFQTKNPNLGKFWKALDWKMFIHFMAFWNIFWRFVIVYDRSVHFVLILYIFSGFGIMYREKSGNPGQKETLINQAVHHGKRSGNTFMQYMIFKAFAPKIVIFTQNAAIYTHKKINSTILFN